MLLKNIKLLFGIILAAHLLKVNRVRSFPRFSRARWAMFFTTIKFFWIVFKYVRQKDKELINK